MIEIAPGNGQSDLSHGIPKSDTRSMVDSELVRGPILKDCNQPINAYLLPLDRPVEMASGLICTGVKSAALALRIAPCQTKAVP